MEYKKGKWEEYELELLRNHYQYGYDVLVSKGLNRTMSGTLQKARLMGLNIVNTFTKKSESWLEEEVKLLVDIYRKEGMRGVIDSSSLNKKEAAIRSKVYLLGLCGTVNDGVLWTKDRLDILNMYYSAEGASGVRRRGVKEPRDIILSKALELGYDVKF